MRRSLLALLFFAATQIASAQPSTRGDANADNAVNTTDIDFLAHHLLGTGDAPLRSCLGDVNADAAVNAKDVFRLIDFLTAAGAQPPGQPTEVCDGADNDCDGLVDEGLTCSVFVSTSGSDASVECTQAAPCRSVTRAIQFAASSGRSMVLVQAGTYNEAGTLMPVSNMKVQGGYDASWQQRPMTPGAAVTNITADADAVIYLNASTNVTIRNLVITGRSASTAGGSSYGIRARAASVVIEDVVFEQGDGADGAQGGSGLDALSLSAPAAAGNGGPGQETQSTCDVTSFGAGRAGATNSCSSSPSSRSMNGGAGGNGGKQDTTCVVVFGVLTCTGGGCTATAGATGANAGYASGQFGIGGAGGAGSNTCGPGLNGSDGLSVNGFGGQGGAGGDVAPNALWEPDQATDGSVGENGSGGGGGGGAGGCDLGTDSYGSGGGGGGAGGCAARGGGRAGQGGGASVGIISEASSITATRCVFYRGIGGRGGDGGIGGRGQPGGAGGIGGPAAGDSQKAGDGGRGAHGGHGGGGGGGAGGPSAGVISRATTVILDGCEFIGGVAGEGGNGGLSAPTAPPAELDGINGSSGGAGQLATMITDPN